MYQNIKADTIDEGYNSQFGNFPNKEKENLNTIIKDASELKNILKNESNQTPSEINFKDLKTNIELAIIYEEAHGNKQVRDYCSSMITRLESLQSRKEFKFFQKENSNNNEKDNLNRKKYIESLNTQKGK